MRFNPHGGLRRDLFANIDRGLVRIYAKRTTCHSGLPTVGGILVIHKVPSYSAVWFIFTLRHWAYAHFAGCFVLRTRIAQIIFMSRERLDHLATLPPLAFFHRVRLGDDDLGNRALTCAHGQGMRLTLLSLLLSISLSPSLSLSHTHTHTHTRARVHKGICD